MPKVYKRRVAQWRAWNAAMLPLDAKAGTWGFTGAEAADHFGVKSNRTLDDD